MAHAAGTVYFDDFQLEKGDTAGAYNYVSNGHFGFDTYAITSSANAAIVSGEEHDQQQGKMVKLTGGAAKESVYSQRIPINCAAGSSFLLSGWAKADSLPAAEGRTFQLSAALHFESGAVQYVEAPFNPDVAGEWQYLSVPVAPERSETIQAVTVSCSYKRNENAAYFDDLSLVMEPCTAYLYNSDGNITAVNTTNRAELTCSYEGADLISQAGGANGNYTYTYDPQTKNITQATNENLQLSLSYDSAGRTTQSRLGNSWGPEYLKTSAGYIEDGSLVAQSEDTLGNQTTYSYTNESYGSPKSETRAASSGTVTQEYGYEANGRLSQTFISGVSSVHYGYSNGQLTSVENGGYIPGVAEKQTQSYSFAYDQYGNRTESRIGARLLARYENDKNTVKSMQYGNSESVSYQYSYDAYNRLKTSNNGEETETYYYNGAGDLSRLEVKHNSSKKLLFVYTYEYDSLGRLIRSREENGGSVRLQEVEYRYNNKNQLTQYTYYDGEQAKSEYVNYNSNGTIASFQPVNGDWQVYYYDGLNRLIRETVDHDANANLQYEISYSYKGQGEENRTTGLVSEKNYHYQNAGQSGVEDYKLSYTYDRVGNIKSSSYQTKRSGDSAAVTRSLGSYSYDQLNQLTVETVYNKSNSLGDIIEYEYDTYGNLRSAKHYAYEKKAGSFLPVKVLKKTESYSYGDSEWKDLLTGYNGQAITYDAIGNPLTYYNGQSYSMSWAHGRQLQGVTTGGKEIGFSYDKDGLRLGKSVGSTGYAYLWAGGRLAEQKWGDNRIIFSYDESGAPQSFYYRNASNSGENYGWGTKYYYVLNAQGDVVQLRDQNNAVVANYQYDAWGKLLYVYDNAGTEITDADHIALINPLRYRGYYYDSETGFYYLQSRYYDPVIRRFINADGYVSIGQGLLGYNMFTYCGNNPVNRNDLTGAFWKEIGDFFKKAGKAVVNFVKSTFGAGATVVRQTRQEIELSPPGVNLFVTVKKGTKENKTLSSRGNSSKPISVYAQGRSDNPLLSSAGLKINIASFTLNVSLGLDNIGISGSVKNGKATNTFGLSADLSQLKIGFESSTTVKWDNDTNVTDYINASVTAWGIAALYILVTTGEWVPSPQPAF